ncbi:NAD(P)H-dependent oxidoreductase [Candidatus Gracilibacteria bacterium]|nr:NAD(P)H-dependent oxidoreductase [Candidatus Gracilibacteria bacterium]
MKKEKKSSKSYASPFREAKIFRLEKKIFWGRMILEMKKLVIITAHPEKDSLCMANADALERGAKKQNLEVARYNAFDFPMLSGSPFKSGFPSTFDVPTVDLEEADFVAVVSPMWNFGSPGALKNFLDGVVQSRKLFQFLPHPILTFLRQLPGTKYIVPEARPVGLMKAKKVLCVWTADGPNWYYHIFPWKNDLFRQVKNIFNYCGVKSVQQKLLGMTRKRNEPQIKNWLKELENYKW